MRVYNIRICVHFRFMDDQEELGEGSRAMYRLLLENFARQKHSCRRADSADYAAGHTLRPGRMKAGWDYLSAFRKRPRILCNVANKI